jgi:hypothetical protein
MWPRLRDAESSVAESSTPRSAVVPNRRTICLPLQAALYRQMAPRFLTIMTGRNLPKIRQLREAGPSTINEKTIANFTLADP